MIDDAIKPFEYGSPARSETTICGRLTDMASSLYYPTKCFVDAVTGYFVVHEDDFSSVRQRAASRDINRRPLDLGEKHLVVTGCVEVGGEPRSVGEPVGRSDHTAAVDRLEVLRETRHRFRRGCAAEEES